MLFVFAALCFFIEYVLDKLLLTYWYEMVPVKSDLLIAISLKTLKFAPIPMFIVAARCLQLEYCMVDNDMNPIEVVNQVIQCPKMWGLPTAMYWIGGTFTVLLFGFEIYTLVIKDKLAKVNMYRENINFFSRLSNLDKMRWLAEEVYMRKALGFQMTSDYTFEKLKVMSEEVFSISYDACSFNILANLEYQKILFYTPVYSQEIDV